MFVCIDNKKRAMSFLGASQRVQNFREGQEQGQGVYGRYAAF